MISGQRCINENLFQTGYGQHSFTPDRKSAEDMLEAITLALHKNTGKDTHRAKHTTLSSTPCVLIAVVTYLPHTWVPAQDSVVFGTTQQQFRVSLAPRNRENSPKIDQKEISHISCTVNSATQSLRKHHAPTLRLRNASSHLYLQPDSSGKESRPRRKS